MAENAHKKRHTLDDLLAVMARLRDPQSGCPWDVKQNFSTIAPYTIEEAYEVADAIARDDLDGAQGRARRSPAAGRLSRADGGRAVALRLRRRGRCHHAEDDSPSSACVRRPMLCAMSSSPANLWERIKAEEKAERGETVAGAASRLDDVPLALPALTRAVKLQKRAAEVGFDWPSLAPVLAKAEEEIAELKEAIAARRRCGESGTAFDQGQGRVRRPPVRDGECRAASQGRSGGRAARGQCQVRSPLQEHRGKRLPRTDGAARTRRSRRWISCGTRRRKPSGRAEASSYDAARSRAGPARRASRSRFSGATRMRSEVTPSPKSERATTSQFS